MKRVSFEKGNQRKFIDEIMVRLSCPSLRGLLQFGFELPYSTLKNYYCERRLLPEDFFRDLIHLAKMDLNNFDVVFLEDNWGKIKGGKKGKRKG